MDRSRAKATDTREDSDVPIDQAALRRRAEEKIKTGALPLQTPDRSWTGPGSGEACGVCGLPIPPTGPEFDLEFGSSAVPTFVRFHRVCLAMWELLRRGQ